MKRPSLLNLYFISIFMLFPICIYSQIAGPKFESFKESKSQNYFIENIGQIVDQNGNPNPNVNYLLNTPGLNVQLKSNGFSYDLHESESNDDEKGSEKNMQAFAFLFDSIPAEKSRVRFHRLEFEFLNINPDLKIVTHYPVSHTLNYYNVAHKPEGVTGVRGFRKVVYENLYSNIDLEFVVPSDISKPVEYNFVIKPKGVIADIQMQIKGAKVNFHKTQLEIETDFGILNEVIPLSWSEKDGLTKNITVKYQELYNDVFGFVSDSDISNDSRTTIDPTPVRQWATYYGGEKDETQYNGDVETDSNGNIFVSGYTRSHNNIATAGSFQTNYSNNTGSWVGYLTKFSSNGVLIWATYYGSRSGFRGLSIDAENNVIAVGETYSSPNIATSGAHQPNLYSSADNHFDGFIVKFDNNGVREWGTYYGGESFDYCIGVSIDSNDNILIAGQTSSNENISSPGSFSEVVNLNVNDNSDSFIVKLNKNGERQWATYYGGTYGVAIDVDSNGSVYLLGIVQSGEAINENISTTGAYQENYSNEGSMSWTDSFLVKFNTNGERQWGTFFGGDSYDEASGLVVDHLNNVIICGSTRSNVFNTTNAFQPSKGGAYYDWDAYLAKFNTNGTIMWNTFYGGTEEDSGLNVDIDGNNNIFLTGGTLSFNNISTTDGYQPNHVVSSNPALTNTDAYISKFDAMGSRIWGTYYGGEFWDSGLDIEITNNGELYLLGYTFGSTNLATSGAHQESFNGEIDNFLVKFKDCLSSINVAVNEFLCAEEDIIFSASGGISYSWSGPNGFTSIEQNPIIFNASTINSGIYSVYIESGNGCNDIRTLEVLVSVRPIANLIDNVEVCEDFYSTGISSSIDTSYIESQVLGGQTGMVVSYFDSSGNILQSPLPNPMTNTIPYFETITVRVANEGNLECYIETNFSLVVNTLPNINLIDDMFACDDNTDGFTDFDLSDVESIILGGQSGMTVEYFNGNGNLIPNPLPNPYINSIPNQEIITIRVINDATDCYNETTFALNVNELPIANVVDALIGCDDNNDGISEYFDTTNVESIVLGPQSGMEVSYFDTLGNILPSPLPNPFTNTQPNTQDITVRVTNPQTSCYSETILTLETATQPEIVQPNNLFACDEGDGFAHFDTLDVENILIGNQLGLDVFYFDESGNELPRPLPSSFLNTTSYTQTINVRVENSLNSLCYSETSFNLVVNELPSINLEDDYLICNLDPSLMLTVSPDYYSYTWYYGDELFSETYEATLVQNGSYSLTVTELSNGIECENTFDFTLSRSVLPEISEVEYDELGSNFIKIIASGDGDFEYSIDGIIYQDSNYFNSISGGIYTAYVRDKYGCGEDSQVVTLIDYPKFFTPNNDGYKDTWQIYGIKSYTNSKIFIYDRYGKLLKQLSPNGIGWDGTFNGKPLNSNDFWFTVDLNNGKTFNGHFTLKR